MLPELGIAQHLWLDAADGHPVRIASSHKDKRVCSAMNIQRVLQIGRFVAQFICALVGGLVAWARIESRVYHKWFSRPMKLD
mmetsp:Transcript_67155/g.111668  ORF Transcript_67155/g.111668 Transcript_67155/m.111668 type:complete len:82 (+) Transcript_67155:319-564(+)